MSHFINEKNINTDTKLFELLQNDLRKLSVEAKKKYPMIKEVILISFKFVCQISNLLHLF